MAAVGSASRLTSSPVNVLALREDARSELEALLATVPGKRICLVLDPALLPVLRLVISEGSRYLKEHNVEMIVELTNDSIARQQSADAVLYLCRPTE